MSRYTLSINIRSDNKELLDNLMVTLETINGSLSEVDAVELYTSCGNDRLASGEQVKYRDPTTTQRNLFLDKWMLAENG